MKVIKLCSDSITSKRKLKTAEIFYIFSCLKHLFWDAGFQAQVYMNQRGTLNSEKSTLLKMKGPFSNTCILVLKMKKSFENYPGFIDIIIGYKGKQKR